ncbi:MAG TPA: tripartite tricarboxylate transporter substrate binding protein [Rhizobiaceae bacterium]|nr:tripartite tricarboxylate transporter substrate binding protein [Rhizobiaceae bacterium]
MRKFIRMAVAAVLSLAALAVEANAEEFPTRPITLVIPWQAGGIPDTQYRLLADIASQELGQPIVVENKPGGVGTLGPASMAANAKPDGYTISYVGTGVYRTPFLLKTTYDPRTDFTYIGGVGQYLFGVVVRADSPLKSWEDFVNYAKENPGKLTYTTFGVNSPLHLAMEQISATLGIKLKHIPSRGNAENNAAVLGGHVMASADGSAWAPLVESGDFRLLVTWGENRTKRWPDVPTLKEVGVDMVETMPYGLAGPAGMDPAVVDCIYAAFDKAIHDPRHLAMLEKFDMTLFEKNPAEFQKWSMEEIDRQEQLVKSFAEKQ